MVPTKRLVALAWLAVAIAIVAGQYAPARAPLFALDAVIVAAALVDLLFVRGKRIELERQAATIFSVGRANPVAITIRAAS